MPYEVWIDMTDPTPQDSDEVARAQRPRAILELIEAGWESASDAEDEAAEDPAADIEDEHIRESLDVRVLTYPERATIVMPQWLLCRVAAGTCWPRTDDRRVLLGISRVCSAS